jgi:hypothetical protein
MKRKAAAIVLLLLTTASEARATDPLEDFPDPAAKQNLVVEARALIGNSRYAEACPKLEESVRLVPDLETHIELANCNEQIGKLAAAWTAFVAVAAQAKAAGHTDREKAARKRASALEPRLPKLVINVPHAPEGLEVRCDGVPIDTADLGAAIPLDPGKHRITATAPGRQRWVMSVESSERTTSYIEVPRELPPSLDPAPAPAAADPRATRKAMRRALARVGNLLQSILTQ